MAPGEPLRFTYFASRGVMGEGDERGFTARRWDRERPELCEAGPAGGHPDPNADADPNPDGRARSGRRGDQPVASGVRRR